MAATRSRVGNPIARDPFGKAEVGGGAVVQPPWCRRVASDWPPEANDLQHLQPIDIPYNDDPLSGTVTRRPGHHRSLGHPKRVLRSPSMVGRAVTGSAPASCTVGVSNGGPPAAPTDESARPPVKHRPSHPGATPTATDGHARHLDKYCEIE